MKKHPAAALLALTLALHSSVASAAPVAATDIADLEMAAQELGVDPESEWTLSTLDAASVEIPVEARAVQPEAELDPSRVRIVGRGIQHKTSGDSIALGCVDEACSQLRGVYFSKSTMKARFIGQTYFIPKAGDLASKQEIKTQLKKINKDFKIYKRKQNQEKRLKLVGLTLLCFGICAFLGPLIISKGAIATATFGMSIAGGAFLLVPLTLLLASNQPLLGRSGIISTVFADQNGWNWESEPKRVSDKTWNLYRGFSGVDTP